MSSSAENGRIRDRETASNGGSCLPWPKQGFVENLTVVLWRCDLLQNRSIVAVALVIVLGLTAAVAQSKAPVRIGYITTQTGEAAMTGEREVRGARLAKNR